MLAAYCRRFEKLPAQRPISHLQNPRGSTDKKPLTAKQVEDILHKAGFIRSHGVGSHRGWFDPASGRHVTIPFHGGRTLPQDTLLAIFRQAGIAKPQR